MGEATDSVMERARPRTRHGYAEQLLYERSPLGFWPTTLILLAFIAASFLAAAAASGVDPLSASRAGTIPDATRNGLALAMLLVTILAAQRYGALRERAEARAFGRVLKGGADEAAAIARLTPEAATLRHATFAGIAAAAAIVVLFYFPSLEALHAATPMAFWFAAVNAVLVILFARGVALTRSAARHNAWVTSERLKIDLLRIEDMNVWGRSAARAAAIWFLVCAVLFLLMLNKTLSLVMGVLVAGCAIMGLWVFFGSMGRVRSRIRAAKADELERIRSQMAQLRSQIAESADAAQKLQGLIAYEKRIHDVSDWPFDQSTLVRFGASSLVLGVPWFGQAAAQYLVDHFVH